MNLYEAKVAVEKLQTYQGKAMKPFDEPIRGFVIVPTEKQAYELMYQRMYEKNLSFDEAIQPYQEDVTIIAYFSAPDQKTAKHCSYEYFISTNSLNM